MSADDGSPLAVRLQVELRTVSNSNGKAPVYRYVPARHFEQGQELYYTVKIHNAGTVAVKDAVVVQAIPANTQYVARSATGAGADITYSVDGGKTFATVELLTRGASVVSSAVANSRVASARVLMPNYTHIRWQFRHPLAPDVVVLARFRVVFN